MILNFVKFAIVGAVAHRKACVFYGSSFRNMVLNDKRHLRNEIIFHGKISE